MSMRTYKAQARELLSGKDFQGLAKWAGSTRSSQRVLFSMTLDADDLIAWRSIEAIGKIGSAEAGSDLERVRDSIRRLFWLMNDESGGLGWRSPELIGEILVNVPSLIDEFAGLLPPFFKEEPFERGSHLAVSRVAAVNPEPFTDCVEILGESLKDPDATIRYYAVSALLAINRKANLPAIGKLRLDTDPITIYDFNTASLVKTTVGRAVTDLIKRLGLSDRAA